jgi:hypothetical protein
MTMDNVRALAPRPTTAPSLRTDNLDTMTVAKLLAGSGFFGEVREQGQALAKILAGAELGIGPIASLMGIYYQKGRLSFSANIMASIVKRSGRYTYRVRRLENDGCTVEFFENGDTIGTSSFTSEDAKAAGLTDGNWTRYPRNMMFARAMSNGCKWFCPDVFGGATPYTPDELGPAVVSENGDMQPIEGKIVNATPVTSELCDAAHWNKTWHATVAGTRFADTETRHKFIAWHTQNRFDSLTAFLAQATEDEASGLITTITRLIAKEAREAEAQQAGEVGQAIDRDDERDARQARPITTAAKLEAAVTQARMLGAQVDLPPDYQQMPESDLQAILDNVTLALEKAAVPA